MVKSLEGKHPDYYEGILQLRDVQPEVADFVRDETALANVPIPKVKDVQNGLDIYLADSNFSKALGKKLQERFGGKVNITATLFGKKDGKDIYRLTVLFRQARFKKGDMVIYRGDSYRVVFVGKEIMLQHSKTGEKVHVKYKEMEKIKPA